MTIAPRIANAANALSAIATHERRAHLYDERSYQLGRKINAVVEDLRVLAERVERMEEHGVPASARAGLSVVSPDSAA
jgi:hypothetical protein